MNDSPNGFEKDYSDQGFNGKLRKYAKAAGREVVEKSLWLYYAAQSPNTPVWAKTTIYGALGYFISLVDAVPDLTPIIGYTDDLGVLAAALAAVAIHITPEVKEKAGVKLQKWFGEDSEIKSDSTDNSDKA